MSDFKVFDSPVFFSGGEVAISGNYSKKDAVNIFSESLEKEIKEDYIFSAFIRWGSECLIKLDNPERYIEDMESDYCCWKACCSDSKGANPVWLIHRK